MHFAAFLGDVDATKMLIEDNADVNAVDKYKYTALHWAADKGHVDVAKVLIQNGVDVNAVDESKQTALHFAAKKGHVDVVSILIQNGASINASDWTEWTALHLAAAGGHVDVVSVLLQNGASINAVDKDNKTPLHVAAENGNVASTLQLLCFGAAIDDKALECDLTKLLRPIKDRLKSLRDGKAMKRTLMSDEERHFMIHVAWFLDRKCPEATFKAYCAIRSFITFHGIFMGVGYGGLGDASVWNKNPYDRD